MLKTLEELITTIRQRKTSANKESYTNKLLNNKNLSIEKVKEEITELIDAVEKNTNKAGYMYILTPKGISIKTKITLNFMKRKMKEYDELKSEIERDK